MKVGVAKETYPGEQRVALAPANVAALTKSGLQVVVEAGAGIAAGYTDDEYEKQGASITTDRVNCLTADIVLQVRSLGANPVAGKADLQHFRKGQFVIGTCDPLGEPQAAADLAATGVTSFGLELIPRITRAQSMDVLSSMATIAGYHAVLMAAVELPKMFPLMMTAAGTLSAARVFVIGAGVAGLQAIATAKRLGAIVHAYDVRPDTREQVESLGGKFVELPIADDSAEDKGGYAKAMDEEFYRKQRELMASVVAESDVVITTAAIPGKPSPQLVTAEAVAGMAPRSVIVDLAAERGGNCAPSKPDERVEYEGVILYGPTNIPSDVPNHASQMYSNNITKFLLNMLEEGTIKLNFQDEIVRDTLVSYEGDVYNNRIRGLLDLPELEPLAADHGDPPPLPTNGDDDNTGTIKVEGLLSTDESDEEEEITKTAEPENTLGTSTNDSSSDTKDESDSSGK